MFVVTDKHIKLELIYILYSFNTVGNFFYRSNIHVEKEKSI